MWIALFSVYAFATSFVEQPFQDSVRDAPILARVKVLNGGEARWSEDVGGMKRLYTYYESSVEDVLKGNLRSGERLELRVLGGEKDGTKVSIPGMATLTSGEDTVLMLSEALPDGSHDVFGLMMGKYAIKKDENGEEYLVGAGISAHSDMAPSDDTEKWTLSRVKDLIRDQGSAPSNPDSAQNSEHPSRPTQGEEEGVSPAVSPDSEGPDHIHQDRDKAAPTGLPASTKIMLGIAIGGLAWIFWRRRKSR